MPTRDETNRLGGTDTDDADLVLAGAEATDPDEAGPLSRLERSAPLVERTRSDDRWTILRASGSVRPQATLRATRYLLMATAAREVRTRYKQNIGRGVWMVVQPAAMVLIYGWVFTEIFQATGEGLPYLSMVWAGIILWQFFQHGVQIGMVSIQMDAGTIPKIWFPRIVIPLAPGTSAFVDLGVGFVLLFITAIIQGVRPDYHSIAAVVPVAVLAIWMYACALLLAPLAIFARDITTIVPLLLRLGFFATPVMYSVKAIPEEYAWLATWNPVAVCINAVRNAVLANGWPDWSDLAIQGAVGSVFLAISYWYFNRVQDRLVDAL